MSETTVIKNGLLVTVDEKFRVIRNGTIVIEKDRIIDLGGSECLKRHKGDIVIDAKGKAVLPGLIPLHFHSYAFPRGLAEKYLAKNLTELLEKVYYPIMASLTKEDTYAETLLTYSEGIKTGSTCFNNMYTRIEGCAKASEEIGARSVLCTEAADEKGQETLRDNEIAFKRLDGKGDGLIRVWFGAEWIPICSKEFFEKARELADKYKTGIHVHVAETNHEVEMCKSRYGKRPAEFLHGLGVLGEDVVAAHSVWLSDEEIKLYSKTGTNVAHCPVSNMTLGCGFARIPEILHEGINVGLGPDAYYTFDMFEIMRTSSFIQRGLKLNPNIMTAETILKMATINGAKALGLQDQIGSLEKGKKADLIILDLATTRFQPLFFGKNPNALNNIAYGAHGDDVETVIIDGKIVMENRVLKTVSEEKVIAKARNSAEKILKDII